MTAGSSHRRTRLAAGAVVLGVALLMSCGIAGQSQQRLAFIGVHVDAMTRQADQKLTEYFFGKVGIPFAREELEYEQVINRLVNWRREDGLFVARMTPYAYVVAELLGANVEPFATYVSRTTNRTTYRSYFVVNRRAFRTQPDLTDLLRFLTERRAKFVYHNQFSTSSFFLPSLYFRSHRIFQMPESTGPLTAIAAENTAEANSSFLVERVARGEADVAAVWDGVKARVESDPAYVGAGGRVYFVELPTLIPNDLLVYPSNLEDSIKNKLKEAIGSMKEAEIDLGDFRTWKHINEATDARLALGDLRQAAREGVAPVTVEIQVKASGSGGVAGAGSLIEAARQAVRLSETEFVLFDADFHEHPDFRWTLEPIHDGAVLLRNAIPGADVGEQAFHLSFRDEEDLTTRIVSIIQSRMHRIRYVWPYSAGAPIVIRDSAFALPPGTPVKVQRVTWIDPQRNQYRAGQVFESRIARASFYRYELLAEDFSRPAAGERPDPMSNVGFRVILVRAEDQPWLFRALTVALVVCFALAGLIAAWTLVRRPSPRPISSHPSVR